MKREYQYQVRGCIEEDCGVRAAEAGEEAQFWRVYKRDAGSVEWEWLFDSNEEVAAREMLAMLGTEERAIIDAAEEWAEKREDWQ